MRTETRTGRELRRAWGAVAFWTLALATAGACGSAPTQPSAVPTPTPTPPPRVALISVDGLRPDAITADGTPHILALAARGAFSWTARTVSPSNTLPGHASMLTGVEPSAHGITFDEYREAFRLATPTALALAREAGKHTVMVAGKAKLRQLAPAGSLDSFVVTTRGDADVVNEAIALLPAGFDLLFVHLPQTDQAGHASGWMSAEYLEQVRLADQGVGRLVAQLPPWTTILVTADHGGHGRDHGSTHPLDMTIPWIVAGPAVSHRGPLTQPVLAVDTAATVLRLLGVVAPPSTAGQVVSEAFAAQ